MSENPQGRARGRARARTRGPAAAVPEHATAGDQPAAPGPSQMQPGGGRRTHRGAPRSDVVRPQEQLSEQITARMGGMEISDSAGRGASRRRYDDDYSLDNTRPVNLTDKRGSSGEAITLVANYFELLSKPSWAVQQYHVEFAPNVESSFMRRGMLASLKDHFGGCYLFDGMSDLKTIARLDPNTELFVQRRTDGENIRITLKHVAELNPSHPELGRLFNTQMRRNLQTLKFQLLGRYYYDQNAISEIPNHNLQVWQGVITSIRQQEEKLMMVVDTVHKVVRKETALEIMKNIISRNAANYQDECVKDLVGSIVMTKYNNRTYRIEDIVWETNPRKSFDCKGGGSITYLEYYKKQYDIIIKDDRQPLLLCTSKEKITRFRGSEQKKIFLIPELCCMTGLTDAMRANFQMMKDLANQTKLDPNMRVKNLHTFISRINKNDTIQEEMGRWGLRFSDNLARFQARVVTSENIVQGNKKYQYDPKTADFSRDMRGKAMHVAKHLDDWLVICTQRDRPLCNEFLSTLNKVCPPMGMKVNQPKIISLPNDRVQSYLQAFKDNLTKTLGIVVFIVPNNKKDRYDALKKNACIEFPIPSQVIVSRTLSKQKMLMSVATKIGIQMNCKLGGEAWAVEIPLAAAMIIGFDTYHDSSKKGRSVGGFVASLNNTFTRWFSCVNFHQAGGWQEMSNNLKLNLKKALDKYKMINGRLPNMIIFYRDGVGDGQIRYVKEWELQQFESTLRELMPDLYRDGKLKSSFIVVNKSINARFFYEVGQNRYGNPPPGTVVDTVVTRADRYDFYLVSQSVNQGTVAPTMYNIISDCSGLKPEYQQRLAYKLTHLYYNWPGTIRVPAPCQYAHKLAFLTGQSLHREPSEHLSDTLFYL